MNPTTTTEGNTVMPEFTRTRTAATAERTSKWELIAAIAEDATACALKITSMDSQLAAKAAFEAAGCDYADRSIKSLCVVAKFDHEATDAQRSTWRGTGWSLINVFAMAGWSQEAVVAWFRASACPTHSRAVAAVRDAAGPKPEPAPMPIDDAWRHWLSAVNRVLTDGARLAERTEVENAELGAHSAIAALIYERLTERKLDAELRELFASVESDA